jgi:hypothetical protein
MRVGVWCWGIGPPLHRSGLEAGHVKFSMKSLLLGFLRLAGRLWCRLHGVERRKAEAGGLRVDIRGLRRITSKNRPVKRGRAGNNAKP